jgi:hypothetical protein
MPIPQCIASRFSPDRSRHKRSTHCSSVPVALRGVRLGAILAGLLFAGGAFAQTPADALSKPDAGPMAPVADPTIPVADPTTPAAKPTRGYDRFYFQTSLVTVHFHPDPNHDDHSHVLNPEYRFDKEWYGGRWVAGVAAFANSFGQPSQYVYGGWMYPIPQHESFYVKLSAGVLHGYKPPYENKIPFNHNGYAPGAIPAAGYCYRKLCSEIIVFGLAGAMWTLGFTIH